MSPIRRRRLGVPVDGGALTDASRVGGVERADERDVARIVALDRRDPPVRVDALHDPDVTLFSGSCP